MLNFQGDKGQSSVDLDKKPLGFCGVNPGLFAGNDQGQEEIRPVGNLLFPSVSEWKHVVLRVD